MTALETGLADRVIGAVQGELPVWVADSEVAAALTSEGEAALAIGQPLSLAGGAALLRIAVGDDAQARRVEAALAGSVVRTVRLRPICECCGTPAEVLGRHADGRPAAEVLLDRLGPPEESPRSKPSASESAGRSGARATGEVRSTPYVDLPDGDPVRWVWPPRIPVGLSFLEGKPASGKSLLTVQLAAALSQGRDPVSWEPTPEGPRSVGLVALEDDAGQVKARLAANGADLARVHAFEGIGANGRPLSLPDDLPALEAWIVRLGLALVVVDPLPYVVSRDGNRYELVGAALVALREVATRTGCAILGVRHLRKGGAFDPGEAGIGSVAWGGAARVVLLVGRDPTDGETRVVALTKSNAGDDRVPSLAFTITDAGGVARLTWRGESSVRAADLTRPVEKPRGAPERSAAEVWLAEALSAGPRAASEVKAEGEAAGFSERTLNRAKATLGVVSERSWGADGRATGWLWRLGQVATRPPRDQVATGPAEVAMWFHQGFRERSPDCHQDPRSGNVVSPGLSRPGDQVATSAARILPGQTTLPPATTPGHVDRTGPEDPEAVAAWLADLLAPGPSPVAEVYETAEAERGFRSTWVARAAQAIGVVAVDLDGERAWALPELARLPERVGVRSAEQEPPRDDREAPTWEDEWAEPF